MAAPGYKQLLVVQGLDTKLDQLRHRFSHHPIRTELAELGEVLVVRQSAIDEVAEGKHEFDRQQKRLDDEVALIKDKRTEIDAKLYDGSVTGTKDLLALQEEAKMLLDRQTAIEDDELEIMEQLEPIEAQLAVLDAAREEIAQQITVKEAELAVELENVETETVTTNGQRDEAATLVSAELRAVYEQLRIDQGGIAITELSGTACAGCNLTLSAVDIDRMKKEPDDAIVTCPECGRLLIL